MPQPTTSPEFLDIVRRSGLIQPDRLEAFLNKYETVGEEPNRVAMALIQEGLLTNFQARQLLKGRYRGFAIGKYLVLEQLGEGGMGKVFLCEHMVMRRRVAIKVLARELANDPSTLLRFQQEARAVAALDHPNIVRAHDVDSEGDNHFIVMEYVDGTSLHDIVRKRGPLSPERASYFIKQAAIGLDQVMLAGMIHRDIKPGNLLLDRKGNVKLLDLGLARFAEEKRESVTQKFDEGSVLGTADYLSPEQAMDSHDVDIRTDIYSLGATFYFLLTGRPPFEGGTVTQKLLFHQMKEPERLAKLRPDLPAELIAVVEKMMAKDRNVRYQKPAEVVAALEPWTQGPPTTPGEDEMPRLSLAAQRAGTAEANPLPNLPPAVQPSISRNNLASSSQRRLSDSGARSTAEGTSTSSVVHLSGVHSGIGTLPGRPGAASGSMRRRPASTIRRRRSRRRWVLLSVGLIALIAGAWWFWPRPKAGGDQVFYISQSLQAPGRAFRSINEALRERDPQRNLRIIIRDQEINEHVRLQPVPNVKAPTLLIIETETAGGGALTGAAQRVRWRPRQGNTAPLLHVEGVPNVEIKDIEFDGQDLVKEVVVIEGECPRFEMTGCHVRAMRQTGIRLVQAQGSERYPISITTTRIYPSDAGDNEVTFVEMASMAGDVGKMCRHIVLGLTLQGKNRPAQGLVITGPVDDVFVRNSFFQDLDNAVWFRRAAVEAAVAGQPIRMRFERTTFDTLRNGFRFENLVSPIPPQITLATCGFMGVQRLAHSDGFVAEPAPATVSNLQWIWTPDVNEQHLARPGKRFFRTTFDLASQPLSAGINVACLDRCRVFVNEAPLTESPVDHEGRVRFWEISRFLTSGTNVVAIEAEIIGTRPSLAGLLVQLTLDVAGMPPLVSDASWRVSIEPRTGWTSRNFSDDDWSYATILSSYTRANKPAWKGLVWEREMVRAHQRVWTPFIVEQTYRDEKSSESFPFVSAPVKSRTEIAEIITPTRAATTARSTTPTRPSTSPTRPTRPSTSPTVPR